MQGSGVRCLGQEDPLEQEMATHSSIIVWEISWTEEPGRLTEHARVHRPGGHLKNQNKKKLLLSIYVNLALAWYVLARHA